MKSVNNKKSTTKDVHINKDAVAKIIEGFTELLYGVLIGEDSRKQETKENDNNKKCSKNKSSG